MTKSSDSGLTFQTTILEASRIPFCSNRYQRYARHGQRLRYLRRLMPIIAGLALIIVVLWPELMIYFDRNPSIVPTFDHKVQVQNQLNNPRFKSTDAYHRPYEIAAQKAVQQTKESMILDVPQSTIELDDGNVLKISATSGFFDVKSKNLDYQKNVVLTTDQGYELKTSQAQLNIKEKQATGSQSVEGIGPTGSFKAMRFKATADGKLHLEGQSHLTITKTSGKDNTVLQP